MKRLGAALVAVLGTILLGGSALAQNKGDNSYYFVTYYSNANTAGAPDATLNIVNDGDVSTAQTEGRPNGEMGALIVVFDDSQEMQECCGCLISADGLLSESVNYELTSNTITGRVPTRGVIKVIGVKFINGNLGDFVPAPGLRATMTHIQTAPPSGNALYDVTETQLADSNLVSAEYNALLQLCEFGFNLGSGQGQCYCSSEVED